MLKNKRGISAVVATILIVLLAVVAVSIVWAVLRPAITKSAEKINTKCLEVDLSLDKCTTDGNITVTLNSGNITKLKIAFYDTKGDSIDNIKEVTEISVPPVPSELERETYKYSLSKSAASANIATFVGLGTEGEEITCGFVLVNPQPCV